MMHTIDSGNIVKIGKYYLLIFHIEQFLNAKLVIISIYYNLFIL